MGTPAFMAPEQALAHWEEVDGRTDIWAVGATMFMLISGQHVHEAQSSQEQLILSATAPARSLATVAPGVPRQVVAIVDRALAFDRSGRWPDASAMQAAVRTVLDALARQRDPAPRRVGGRARRCSARPPSAARPSAGATLIDTTGLASGVAAWTQEREVRQLETTKLRGVDRRGAGSLLGGQEEHGGGAEAPRGRPRRAHLARAVVHAAGRDADRGRRGRAQGGPARAGVHRAAGAGRPRGVRRRGRSGARSDRARSIARPSPRRATWSSTKRRSRRTTRPRSGRGSSCSASPRSWPSPCSSRPSSGAPRASSSRPRRPTRRSTERGQRPLAATLRRALRSP